MPIVLFTDFGATDLYLGQIKAVLAARAPRSIVHDALHEAPPFGIEAGAHLLAALAARYPRGSVFMAVVDPGVGGARRALVVDADGRSFVGPDNGLLSVLWERAMRRRCRCIRWRPQTLSASFHGRDLFAPVAAALARRRVPRDWLVPQLAPMVTLSSGDLAQVIYVDHYGNAITGLRAAGLTEASRLRVRGQLLRHATTFVDVPARTPFWYENSLGLVEVAANRASAARMLGLRVGSKVALTRAGAEIPRVNSPESRGSR